MNISNAAADYQTVWEQYWHAIEKTGIDGEVFWDVEPDQAAERDWTILSKYFDPSLPLLDLGCGNGRQTRFFSRHSSKVIGVDFSEAAIALATIETTGDYANLEYRIHNALDIAQSESLRAEFGDMNIYSRGVIHSILRPDRPALVASIEVLLGARGTLYQMDTHTSAPEYLRSLRGDHPSGLPKEFFRVLSCGIHPIGFDEEDRAALYPSERWEILEDGTSVTIDTIPLSNGEQAHIPAYYMVARRKPRDQEYDSERGAAIGGLQ